MEAAMVQFDPRLRLPTAEELPDSDETPVDNELQNLVPNLLGQILALLWQHRDDWFFGVDMGIYADTEQPYRAIIPDAFLSLDVQRRTRPNGRLSYVLWEEGGIVPVLVLEVVSQTYRGEYETKLEEYRQLDVSYYVVYDPNRDQPEHDPLEVYKLIDGQYVRLPGEPVWLEELGLGIGRGMGEYSGWEREWLYWYSEQGERYLSAEEFQQYRADLAESQVDHERQRADHERQRAEYERQRAELIQAREEKLRKHLLSLGIDPDTLPK